MDLIARLNTVVNDFVWGPPMLILLVGVGVWFTLRLGVFQVSRIGLWWKTTAGTLLKRQKAGEGAITPFQALTTALAATVGTGNMVGVATAIVSGGPGAVFWMWVSAFFGMMTKYAEIVLSQKYRRRNAKGEWVGGPMYYISEGLGPKFGVLAKILAALFAVFGALATFGIGNMTQVNAIASSLETLMGQLGVLTPVGDDAFSWFKLGVGIVLALLAALVIIGGLKRIGSVSEKLVPFMCLIYIAGGTAALVINRANILPAFGLIFKAAFDPQAVMGGILGTTVMQAMRFGIARGVFSNEAGLGSAPIAHASADTDSPVKQGMWGVFEVFMDTLVICTFTAMVLLTSGVYVGPTTPDGSAFTIAAFGNSFGVLGTMFVSLCITLFAFSTLLSWSLYGQRCLEYLTGGKGLGIYKLLFIAAIVVAAVMRLDLVWDIADTLNGLMAIPNLIALVALSGVVIGLTKEYLANIKTEKAKKK